MKICVAHGNSPQQDCPVCEVYVAHMDEVADTVEVRHSLLATQLVSIAEQVDVPCTHADAQFYLETADQDLDQALERLLAAGFTAAASFSAQPDHDVADRGCGPASPSQPADDVTADSSNKAGIPQQQDAIGQLYLAQQDHDSSGCACGPAVAPPCQPDDVAAPNSNGGMTIRDNAAVQPQQQAEDVPSQGIVHEQRTAISDGRPQAASTAGSSKFDEFRIGAAPFHNVQVTLMSPAFVGQVAGQLSKKIPLRDLVSEICRILVAPNIEVQMLQQGKPLDHHRTLMDSGMHLPRRDGIVDVTLHFSQPVELHRHEVVTKSPNWVENFSINGGKARMCGACGSGPIINEQCSNMAAHNEGNVNSCKACGWHKRNWEDWPLWDGGKKRVASCL